MHAQFAQFTCNIETGSVCLKNEGGDAPATSLWPRFSIDNQHIGNGTVGNEHFGAIEQVASIGRACRRLDAHGVGARIRLGEG